MVICLLFVSVVTQWVFAGAEERWPERKAAQWYERQAWPVGANYIPSTAINQLEMWQAETFDPVTIDRELGWAEQIGFNTMRVFLHNLPYQIDSKAYLQRIENFLQIADKHHIKIMFVIFDSVWDPDPQMGKQPTPRPHVHNSGWVQSPGAELLRNPQRWEAELKPYVVGVIRHFRKDPRVFMWDLMNEPDNGNGSPLKERDLPDKAAGALHLLQQEWAWAREAKPSQPLTSGVWRGDWSSDDKLTATEKFQLSNSDVITFHNYEALSSMQSHVAWLERYQRPILCTEYMARPQGSTFLNILPFLKQKKVGAYNWGFVSGKTQTIYPWDSWQRKYSAEPEVWFHDVLRANGEPFDPKEIQLIRQLSGYSK